jgi:hypothetical protein
MAGDDKIAAALTRALLLGATVGAGPLLQVGCAPVPQAETVRAEGAVQAPARTTPRASEDEMCARAMDTRAARDVEALIRAYPGGDCVAPTLGAMPPATLAAISPAAIQGLTPAVRSRIPASAQRHLRNLSGGNDGDRGGY